MPPLSSFSLIIFDKDGTLIDFDAMWAGWVIELADRLEKSVGSDARAAVFRALAFDPERGRTLAGGPLAIYPMSAIRALTVETLEQLGVAPAQAADAVAQAWHVPDPVATARPLTDLKKLFVGLRDRGLKIAIATADDRASTKGTLDGLGLMTLVDEMVCADDGVAPKPAPDKIFWVCQRLQIDPARAVMVGDSLADLQMGRNAGVGGVIGVLSGVSDRATLEAEADVVLGSVAELIPA